MVLALSATVLTGGRRFAHFERLRSDEVVRATLRLRWMPSSITLTRYFGNFLRSQVEHLSEVLSRALATLLRPVAGGEMLDLELTISHRFGRQDGSLKDHNPRRHGRPSHHPLLAMLARQKLILHAWMRSGNSARLAVPRRSWPKPWRAYSQVIRCAPCTPQAASSCRASSTSWNAYSCRNSWRCE